MASLKIIIPKYLSQSDNTYSVRIRLIHDREVAFIRTCYRLRPDEITASGKIKPDEVQTQLADMIITMRKKLTSMGMKIRNYKARDLGDLLEREIAIKDGIADKGIDFIDFGRRLIERKADQRLTAEYKTTLNMIVRYTGKEFLDINSITYRWLTGFEEWIRTQPSCKSKGSVLSETTINHYMRSVRAIYNKAQNEYNDDERGELPIPFYPFRKYRVPPEGEAKSRAKGADEIRLIRDYIPKLTRDELGRDIFMLSFYLMGMNLPDLMKCDRLENNRLIYTRGKVEWKRGRDAEISVLIPPEAAAIVEKYTDPDKGRVFDFYKRYSTENNFTQAVNKGLKMISPELTLYYARHSFASIASNDCGYSIDDIGRCLNHAVDKRVVTNKYIKKDFSRNDKVQRSVIDFVFQRK